MGGKTLAHLRDVFHHINGMNSRIGIINIKRFETREGKKEVNLPSTASTSTLSNLGGIDPSSSEEKRYRRATFPKNIISPSCQIPLASISGGIDLRKDEFNGELIGKRIDLRRRNHRKCPILAWFYKIRFSIKEFKFQTILSGMLYKMEMDLYTTHHEISTYGKQIIRCHQSRFGGNDESKKIQKYILKQQFEGFSVSNSKGLHKGYDRFQSLLSQLEIHGAGVSSEDANKKFLSTNDVSTTYGVSNPSGQNSQYEMHPSYSLLAKSIVALNWIMKELEQLDEFD
ncbi:hypothetical protein Tco_1247279 [Tanacetum coccineum]